MTRINTARLQLSQDLGRRLLKPRVRRVFPRCAPYVAAITPVQIRKFQVLDPALLYPACKKRKETLENEPGTRLRKTAKQVQEESETSSKVLERASQGRASQGQSEWIQTVCIRTETVDVEDDKIER